MVSELRIYFEGDKALRRGFDAFLGEIKNRARELRIHWHLIACKGRATEDFRIALQTHPRAWNILLRDSDGPDDGALAPPRGADAKSVFWMVQLMEAWFLADPEALEQYYGQRFNKKALRPNPKIEEITKFDVLTCLNEATGNTQKGAYHKTQHAPAILERINPGKVKKAAPNCQRMFNEILTRLEGP